VGDAAGHGAGVAAIAAWAAAQHERASASAAGAAGQPAAERGRTGRGQPAGGRRGGVGRCLAPRGPCAAPLISRGAARAQRDRRPPRVRGTSAHPASSGQDGAAGSSRRWASGYSSAGRRASVRWRRRAARCERRAKRFPGPISSPAPWRSSPRWSRWSPRSGGRPARRCSEGPLGAPPKARRPRSGRQSVTCSSRRSHNDRDRGRAHLDVARSLLFGGQIWTERLSWHAARPFWEGRAADGHH
jgi:hypothetical protein